MKPFAEWMLEHPPPTLAELIERRGRYDKITAEDWADFDRRMEEWQLAYRERHRE